MFWTYSILLKIQFRGRTFFDCGLLDSDASNDNTDRVGCDPVDDLTDTLDFPRNVEESPALEIGVLFAMLISLRYVVYLILVWKTRRV